MENLGVTKFGTKSIAKWFFPNLLKKELLRPLLLDIL